ncbi:hypothetical protein H310_07953 [Aphanomyces invadans]|uniref:Rad4 beta-hairpin domain-containing protein n=1 Tax=Aphanomyces invadans TaxID=157072 RepID=A0A024U126_9STRA|nr:hypothetical protein H310_07953 [Aphanomyces invadans]ETV99928.1 hypothetical protein H310_07953 [Aphanomyces invadans]RHY33964.1 hypothetical protein DYB32_001249 [Aphanomyces invadans]|eukprot:XP_008871704.1 hypothetical protein H310_07953 [Aphanomyces invadans]
MEFEWGGGSSPFDDVDKQQHNGHDDDASLLANHTHAYDDSDDDAWEDVSNNGKSVHPNDDTGVFSDDSDHVHETSSDLQVEKLPEDWDALNAALNAQVAAEGDGNKTKSKVKRLTKTEKSELMVQRQAHLVCLLAREVQVNAAINDVTLQSLVRSIVPAHVDVNVAASNQARHGVVYVVQTLMRWFRLTFRRLPYTDIGDEGVDFDVTAASLLRVFFNRGGYEHEMVPLFTALCRSYGIPTRHTSCLDTPHVVKRNAPFDPHFGIPIDGLAACTDENGNEGEATRKLTDRRSLRSWCEVYSDASAILPLSHEKKAPMSSSWVHVDVIRSLVNQPFEVGRLRGRGAVMPHIVSIDDEGRIVDVSRLYAIDWARTQPLRCHEAWWARQLRVGSTNANPIDVEAPNLPLPTSVQGFKNHAQYCLEQHLGMYEWIRPRKPVGLFKGMPVFERSAVHTLQSAHRWLRQGRVVVAAEQPCKLVAKRQHAPPTQTSMYANPVPFSVATAAVPPAGDEKEAEQLPLFGLWQTEKFAAAPVVDGIVPKNEHGNIEIWSEAHLPAGSVHIRLPRAKVVAMQLGVDFAPAMVGWEARNGRNVPVFDGIVVCENAASMIEDAHAVLEHSLVEKAVAKHRKEIAKRWAVFAKKLLLRKRLREEYG